MDLTRSSATVAAARTLDETDAVRVVRAVAMLFGRELEAAREDASGPADTQPDYRRLAHGRVSWRCVNREAVQRVHLQRLCEAGVFLMYDTGDANRLIAGLLRRDACFTDAMRAMNCHWVCENSSLASISLLDLNCFVVPMATLASISWLFVVFFAIFGSLLCGLLISLGIDSGSRLWVGAGVANALIMLFAAIFASDYRSYTLWAMHQREFHCALQDLESDLTEIRQKLGLSPNPHVGVPVAPTTVMCACQ